MSDKPLDCGHGWLERLPAATHSRVDFSLGLARSPAETDSHHSTKPTSEPSGSLPRPWINPDKGLPYVEEHRLGSASGTPQACTYFLAARYRQTRKFWPASRDRRWARRDRCGRRVDEGCTSMPDSDLEISSEFETEPVWAKYSPAIGFRALEFPVR